MPTAAELQAAAAAAAQYTQTAEQAAMLNAAYRANQLPVLPQYGTGSGITREQYEDAQNEAIKHQIAFSQPRNDVRQLSGEAARISQEYAASRNRVVTGGGVSYQGPAQQYNPYGDGNAAAIAWEVGRTGGATDYQMNLIAEREVVAAGGDPGFIRYATDIYQERPQFEREILTTKTGQQFVNEEWHGVPIRMNLTKAEVAAGGGITQDNYGKFLRYDTESYQLNRLSEPTTQFGIDAGVHKARGDFGGPWLEGGTYGGWRSGGGGPGNIKGSTLVAREGSLTDISYTEANAKQPFVSARYNPEISTIENPSGKIFGAYIPGISEGIAFFEPKRKVTITEKRTPMGTVTNFGEPYTEGDTAFYPSTTKSGDIVETTTVSTPIPGSSGFDEFESNIRKMVPSSPVGEKAFEIASAVTPFSTGFAPLRAGREIAFGAADTLGIKTAEARKTSSDIVASTDMFKGQYESFYEHPTLAVGSYAAGAVFGTAFKAVGAIGGAARSRMAPALISRGQSVRAVEMAGAGMWKAAQVGMAGVYAADLSGRATKGFTDLSPASVAPRARAMAVQEFYPMIVGFGAPDKAIKAVRMSDIGFKQAVLEKQTTGRADWYIRQPVTRVASRPVDLIKQDYRAFLQEQAAKTPQVQIRKPGFTDYLSYKIDKPVVPESSTIRISQRYTPTELGLQPVSTEYGADIIRPAYGKQNIIGQTISKKLGIGRTPVPESPLLRTSESTVYQGGVWTKVTREPVGEVSPDLSLKAYGKQKTLFESSAGIMQESHQYARYLSESKAMGLSRVYPTMPVNLRVKAFMQEHPSKFISNAKIMLWEPEMEISNINRASRVRLGDMFKGSPRPKGKSTLNIWDTQAQPFISRAPTAYPESKTSETKTKGGQTLVSRTEMAQTSFPEVMQESGFRGGIVYPSGPSPVQRRSSYVVTEEEEYYRLPPGMKSPSKQRQETIQSVMQVPMAASGFSTMTTQMPSLITRQSQESRVKSDIFQMSRQDQRMKPDLAFRSFQERIPARDIFERTGQETRLVSEPRFDITQRFDQSQRTRTEQRTTQITDEIIRTPPPPPPPPPPTGFGGGGFFPGGGGSRQYGNLGVTQWRRENLVADMPYLARGMRQIELGMGAGSGTEKWFGGKKKRRKSKKK